MNKPPCSIWKVWKGPEVEGKEGIGVSTLFIRSLEDFPPITDYGLFAATLKEKSKCANVWFCKEYRDWNLIRACVGLFADVRIEVEAPAMNGIPKDLRTSCKLFIKVITLFDLKPGDVVCVGEPFRDEAFIIGEGVKVTPDLYLKDVRIR